MNLKKQLKSILKTSKKETKEEQQRRIEYSEPIIRTDEDWKIISEYLRNLFIKCDSKSKVLVNFGLNKKREYSVIYCTPDIIKPKRDMSFEKKLECIFDSCDCNIEEYSRISLSNGAKMEIHNEDVQRFCNQYNIDLAYLNCDCEFSTEYPGTAETRAYLIGQRPMLRTNSEWNIIDEYLKNLLKDLVSKQMVKKIKVTYGIKKNFICIDFKSKYLKPNIILETGEELEIHDIDMEMFCKQHNLKLEYGYMTEMIIQTSAIGTLEYIEFVPIKEPKYRIEYHIMV